MAFALVLLSAPHHAFAQDDTRLSKTRRGLGLVLADREGQIVIHKIRPGSIAANSDSIEEGARLTALKIGNKKTSLARKRARDVSNLVRGASFDQPDVTIWFIAKNDELESTVTLRRSLVDMQSDPKLRRLKIEEPTPIERVLSEFNRRAKYDTVGKTQPPITVNEVIARIGSLNQQQASSRTDDVMEIFRGIAETKVIPAGSELSVINRWVNNDSVITVWWVDLKIQTGKGTTNGFRIRDQTISARAMTADEKVELKRSNAEIRKHFPSHFQ